MHPLSCMLTHTYLLLPPSPLLPHPQGRGRVLDTLAEIQERHRAVKDLEQSLLELHQIFLDMAVLVEAQVGCGGVGVGGEGHGWWCWCVCLCRCWVWCGMVVRTEVGVGGYQCGVGLGPGLRLVWGLGWVAGAEV